MTPYSFGNKQYIAVEGREAAFKLANSIMEARDCQVMVQRDDANIYIVSWANRYGNDGECFVFMDEDNYDDYINMLDAAREDVASKLN